MAPKQQLDKSAWQWAESTDPEAVSAVHIYTAYRLGLKPCKQGTCRRNCKGNPRCLLGLGEKDWFGEIEDSYWHDIDDPSVERRKDGEFVGLKNLGATCYVNTLLQLWFHNLPLRSAILKLEESFNMSAKCDQQQPLSLLEHEEALMPSTVCGHLQLIFALLQHSKRRHIDPTPFINCLGLDAAQQQDAQEFSKLFMSLLEDTLHQQQIPDVRNLVQQQFTGIYHYVTVCSVCLGGSRCISTFYELDLNIKGHKHLSECIDEFLMEEKLDGVNQYMCTGCNVKRNAARRIQLQSLPPVLNIQLLRFVFDRQSGTKKKLNTYIQFPEVLDMSHFLGQAEGSCVYDLYAVLIHRGPSAYSGHYVAHIHHQTSGFWYKFNDEEIEKMGSKSLSLSKEEDIDLHSKNGERKPKTQRGCHASRNAYMLVYCQRTKAAVVHDIPTLEMLPWQVQQSVALDNQRFEDWVTDMEKMRNDNVTRGRGRQAEVIQTYSRLPATQIEDMEWIPTKWLSEWLGGDGKGPVPQVDTELLQCQHHKVDPDKVINGKCVSSEACDLIYAKYGGKDRLKGSMSLCKTCVTERCRTLRQRTRIAEDSKLIGQLLKGQSNDVGDVSGYWVGKASLRGWRGLALTAMEKEQKARDGCNGAAGSEVNNSSEDCVIMDGAAASTPSTSSAHSTAKTVTQENQPSVNDNDQLSFNDDLLCDLHGNLSIDETCRRPVPTEIWNRLKLYFPDAPEFPAETGSCDLCEAEREKEDQQKVKQKTVAAEQKALLSDLYHCKNRPSWKADVNQLWVLSNSFVDEWRKFIRDPTRNEPPQIMNGSMLCPHGGFLYQPEMIGTDETTERFEYLHHDEWQNLKNYVCVDVEIVVTRIHESDGRVTFIVQPDLCRDCCSSREEAEIQTRLCYSTAVIYVRKLTPEHTLAALELEADDIISGDIDPPNDSLYEADVEYQQKGKSLKRKKGPEPSFPEKCAKAIDGTARRSSRHRRMRGEKDITVASTMTLRDLKLEVMKLFSVAPFDQHLLLNGKELTGDKDTLATHRILPGVVLYLKADEPMEDPTFLENVQDRITEEGFKGTGLLGR